MEIYDGIRELLGSYGFPILACAALFISSINERKETHAMIQAMQEMHKEEVDHLAEVIENNTKAILSLKEV